MALGWYDYTIVILFGVFVLWATARCDPEPVYADWASSSVAGLLGGSSDDAPAYSVEVYREPGWDCRVFVPTGGYARPVTVQCKSP